MDVDGEGARALGIAAVTQRERVAAGFYNIWKV